MINWIWNYREFITAYDRDYLQSDWDKYYWDFYVMPNMELLNEIYFKPKGLITKDNILMRISSLGKEYFGEMRNNIGNMEEFEENIIKQTQAILSNFNEQPEDLDLYVIVGLDVTNIYSTPYQGKNITVLCLESVNGDMKKLNLLLSHECHHLIRNSYFKDKLFGHCVGERAVTEGFAINFSEVLFPGNSINDYCYVPEATVKWVIEHWNVIDKVMCENIYVNDNESGFFTRNRTSGLIIGEQPRIGYVYGYLKVKEYMEKEKSNPIDLVNLNWEKVFKL